MRIRDFGVDVGYLPCGPLDKITDVPGVLVGHATVRDEAAGVRTGVTAVAPCPDNSFARKLTAACYVHNGFGKTCGTVQVEELGTLETPVALTNTLCVGRVADALVGHVLERCGREGVEALSINPVVGECNDARLNRIALRRCGAPELEAALADARADFSEGAVGAGAGTVCFGLKGGIGSASRLVEVGGRAYVLGVLVQSNFGATRDLVVDGRPLGRDIERALSGEGEPSAAAHPEPGSALGAAALAASEPASGAAPVLVPRTPSDALTGAVPAPALGAPSTSTPGPAPTPGVPSASAPVPAPMPGTPSTSAPGPTPGRASASLLSPDDRGSIMTVVATDLPLDTRQLRRVIRRAGVGIARTGGYTGHGSGEVMIGFTTANRVEPGGGELRSQQVVREDVLNRAFLAVAEATHEAILNSMVTSPAARALNGSVVHSLAEFLTRR